MNSNCKKESVFSTVLPHSELKQRWYLNRQIAADFDFIRVCLYMAFEMRSSLVTQGIIPSSGDNAFSTWIDHLHRQYQKVSSMHMTYKAFFHTNLLTPILWDDWDVHRDQSLVSEKLGMRSFYALQDSIAERFRSRGDTDLVHLHLGPGDGSLMRELRLNGDKESTPWQHFGIGDKLYFSLEKVLDQFVNSSEDVSRFIKIFSVFITREFRKVHDRLSDSKGKDAVSMEFVWDLLRTAPQWIHEHYNVGSKKYLSSYEFQQDQELEVTGVAQQLLDEISQTDDVEALYSRIFVPEFVDSIFCQSRKLRKIDIYKSIRVWPEGFILGKFQTIGQHIPSESIALMHGCRSDSHLSAQEFNMCLLLHLGLLKPGGVYISDGIRQSYTRILRFQGALGLINDLAGQFRAFAVVCKKTKEPLSMYIERGIPKPQTRAEVRHFRSPLKEEGYKYYDFASQVELVRGFDFNEVELVPLSEIVNRPDVKLETAVRSAILSQANGDRDAFKGINDTIRSVVLNVLKGSNDHPLKDVDISASVFQMLKSGKEVNPESVRKLLHSA